MVSISDLNIILTSKHNAIFVILKCNIIAESMIDSIMHTSLYVLSYDTIKEQDSVPELCASIIVLSFKISFRKRLKILIIVVWISNV